MNKEDKEENVDNCDHIIGVIANIGIKLTIVCFVIKVIWEVWPK